MDHPCHAGTARMRPLRDLMRLLPRLPAAADGEIDMASCDEATLRALHEHAEGCLQVAQLGMGAIGTLLVHAAPEMDVGEVSGDTIEALGQLIAELGELSAQCLMLVAACRRHLRSGERRREVLFNDPHPPATSTASRTHWPD